MVAHSSGASKALVNPNMAHKTPQPLRWHKIYLSVIVFTLLILLFLHRFSSHFAG